MADNKEVNQQQAATMQKLVSLKDDGYYANCSMLESTPFDVSILFGKVRPSPTRRDRDPWWKSMKDRFTFLTCRQGLFMMRWEEDCKL